MRLPDDRPALMGILNVTPDSFSDGGMHFTLQDAVDAGLRMVDDGADILDVGGESTRPGAQPVEADEELRRVLPVVEALATRGLVVSVDTMKAEVARLSLLAGAQIVNDVSAFGNSRMLEVCVNAQTTVCVMHMQGTPQTMQLAPEYGDVVEEVVSGLVAVAENANLAGIPDGQIWIDPGIGFGKTDEHNFALLRNLSRFVETGYPVLLGVSRKGFIGRALARKGTALSVGERLEGTLAIQVAAQLDGVRILRAHDVLASRRAIDMTSRLRPDPG